MSLTQTAAPTVEPISLDEAKTFCRIDHDEEDDDIRALITSARMTCESFNGRQFCTATWALRLDSFPTDTEGLIELLPPVQSVTSIAYIDPDGVAQTLSASLYSLDIYSEPARLRPAYGQSWPATRDVMNAVTVTFVAGYGAAADVPEPKRLAVRRAVVYSYENRGNIIIGTILAELPDTTKSLLWTDRITGWEGRYD